MSFKFTDRTFQVEIEGKKYDINLGTAETMDKLEEVRKEIDTMSSEKLAKDKQANYKLSCSLRDFIAAILGEKARDEIFKGRNHNVIEELELIAYIYEESKKQEKESSLDGLLQELGVGSV